MLPLGSVFPAARIRALSPFAQIAYLDQIGHAGARVLINSDLGRVEWRQSLAVCERLAQR
jgi:hypothetical protein